MIRKSLKTKSIYTLDNFKLLVLKAFGNDPKVSFTYIAAIYDFKGYYDQFLDEKVANKQFSQVEKLSSYSELLL